MQKRNRDEIEVEKTTEMEKKIIIEKIFVVVVVVGLIERKNYLRKNKEPSGNTTLRSDGTNGVPL